MIDIIGTDQIGSGGGTSKLKLQPVEFLPDVSEAKKGVIYLVPAKEGEEDDLFEEWIVVDNNWEKIGGGKINLSKYATLESLQDLEYQLYNDDEEEGALGDIVKLQQKVGKLNELSTEEKSSLVGAINEVAHKGGGNNPWVIHQELQLSENVHSIQFDNIDAEEVTVVWGGTNSWKQGSPFNTIGYYSPVLTTVDNVGAQITLEDGSVVYRIFRIANIGRGVVFTISLRMGIVFVRANGWSEILSSSSIISDFTLSNGNNKIQKIVLTPDTTTVDFTPGGSNHEKIWILKR